MNITGKVFKVLPVESGVSQSGKEWKRATIVVEYSSGQYPKRLAVSNVKNADNFAQLKEGTEVSLEVDVESREYQGKWYTSATCWKWSTPEASSAQQAAVAQQVPSPQQPTNPKQGQQTLYGDDLPF